MNSNTTRKTNAGVIWLLLSAVFAASALLPLPHGANAQIGTLPPLCLFYHLTGLPCPGCGLTRSFVFLGHGHFYDALHWHPLGPAVYLLCALLWLRCGVFYQLGVTVLPLPSRTFSRLSALACLLVVSTGIARIVWLSAHHLRF